MKIRRILCPVDFSRFDEATNEYASVLAKSTGAEMVYFHVTIPEAPYGSYAHTDASSEMDRDLARLKQIQPSVEGVSADWVVDFGMPAARIVEYASSNDVDLIVMNTHGRSGVRRLLMGSVAEAVVRTAACPVLALKSETRVPQPN